MIWFKRKAKEVAKKPLDKPKQRSLLLVTNHHGWPTQGLRAISWKDISAVGNIRDFDDIVLDLSTAPRKPAMFDPYSDEEVTIWRSFDLAFERSKTLEFLGQGGRLVLLGNPRFWTPTASPFGGWDGRARHDATSFLGLSFDWDPSEGVQIVMGETAKQRGLDEYLRANKSYDISLIQASATCKRDDYGNEVYGPPLSQFESLASTRSGRSIAFTFAWPGPQGEVTFLPLPSSVGADGIRQVVTGYLAHDLKDMIPSWLRHIRVPEEKLLDEKLVDIEAQRQALVLAEQKVEQERAHARRPLLLLYGADHELESVVLACLTELGGTITPSSDRTKEDGWISVLIGGNEHFGVLEIKSVQTESFSVRGIRQLSEWVQRGHTIYNRAHKPIFIGSSLIREPVDNRPNPFVHDVIQTANQFGAALLRSDDLFRVLMEHRQGRLDASLFWKRVFSTEGQVSTDDLVPGFRW